MFSRVLDRAQLEARAAEGTGLVLSDFNEIHSHYLSIAKVKNRWGHDISKLCVKGNEPSLRYVLCILHSTFNSAWCLARQRSSLSCTITAVPACDGYVEQAAKKLCFEPLLFYVTHCPAK